MTKYEKFSVDHHLTHYDDTMGFEEILDAVEEGDESILVWQLYENMTGPKLAQSIDEMAAVLC